MPQASSLRTTALALLALAAPLALSACDQYEDDNDDLGATVVDFSIDSDAYVLNGGDLIASFESDDIDSGDDREDVRDALRAGGDGALVMLYVESDDVLTEFEGTGQTYTALPLTRGYEEGSSDLNTITVTYAYSFDNGDLYFDVLSSAPIDFDSFLPDDFDFRLVTIPASYYAGRAGARIDLRDYAAVKAAFNLPD